MSESSSRLAFTATQWQELEHQALIFKYMVSGLPIPPDPIPPDLLFTLQRSLDSSSLSSNLVLHQPQNVGWNYVQIGFGRKIDPEPGRCRRTDGKKWRCSKEAYPDSKYCERHMHRGRNRSRKPVEIITNQTTKSTTTNNPSKSSTPKAIPISPISKNPHPSLDKDYGYGNVTRFSGSSMNDPWQVIPNVTVGSSLAHSKQRNCSVLQNQEQDQYFHFLNRDYKSEMHLKTVRDDEPQRVMHHFFDEWPKNRDSWLDSEGKSSNYEPVATTQLSISMPNYYDDFFMGHNGK